LYQFGRYLLRRLPRRGDPTVDIGEVQLSHLRVTSTGEHDLSLTPEGEQELPGFGTGTATATEPELVSLDQIITAINERYGLGLTDGDRIWWEQQIVASTEDPEVEAAALVNSEANFAEVFDPKFGDIVIDRQTANEKQFRRFFTEDTYRHQLTDLARRAAYQMIRRRHALA
jgi:type I restriction enzyme R subunit